MKKLMNVAVILSAVDKMSAVIDMAVNRSSAKLAAFSKKASMMGDKAFNWSKKALATGALVTFALFKTVQAAEDGANEFARLDNILTQMGVNVPGLADEMKAFADTTQFEIGVDGGNIQMVQAKLATFQNVVNKTARDAGVFKRATMLAFDLEAAGFGEGTANAVQLGKALNDPIKGINALTKSGITFTAEEKKKIETLVKSGRTLEAQEIILKAIENQVGGTAKKTAKSSEIMKIAMGEFVEEIGGALLPAFQEFTQFITKKILPGFVKWKSEHTGLFNTIVKLVAVFGLAATVIGSFGMVFGAVMKGISAGAQVLKLFTYVTKLATAAQWLMNAAAAANPYVLIAIAIIAIIAAIVLVMVYFDQLYDWFMKQSVGVKILIAALVLLFAPFLIFPIMIRLLIKNWDLVKAKFNQFLGWFRGWGKFILLPLAPLIGIPLLIVAYWGRIRSFFVGLWGFVVRVFRMHVAIIMAIPGLIQARWVAMINFYRNLWENIKSVFSAAVNWVFGIHTRMYEAGMNIMNSLWEGLKATMNKPLDVIRNVTNEIRDYFPFSPAKRGALKDIHKIRLMETVAQSVKPNAVMQAMGKATNAIASAGRFPVGAAMQPAVNAMNNIKGSPQVPAGGGMGGVVFSPNYNITVNGGDGAGTELKDQFLQLARLHGAEMMRMLKGLMANEERKKF